MMGDPNYISLQASPDLERISSVCNMAASRAATNVLLIQCHEGLNAFYPCGFRLMTTAQTVS